MSTTPTTERPGRYTTGEWLKAALVAQAQCYDAHIACGGGEVENEGDVCHGCGATALDPDDWIDWISLSTDDVADATCTVLRHLEAVVEAAREFVERGRPRPGGEGEFCALHRALTALDRQEEE